MARDIRCPQWVPRGRSRRCACERDSKDGRRRDVVKRAGGAHRDPGGAARNVKAAVLRALGRLRSVAVEELLAARYRKYREMGYFVE